MAQTNVQAFSGDVEISSNLAVDTNTLFVDSVGNKVGVGTTEPGATLEVTGNAFVSSNLEVGTADLFVDTVNSRVGIGMTDPGSKLSVYDVSSNLTAVSIITDGASVTNEPSFSILDMKDENGAGGYIKGFHNPFVSNGLQFGSIAGNSRSTEVMTILASGNVGIGTASPTGKLQIRSERSSIYATDTASLVSNAAINISSNFDPADYLSIGLLGATYSPDGNNPSAYMQVQWDTGNTPYTAPLLLNPIGGNVGIGVTNPGAKLQIGANNETSPQYLWIRGNRLNEAGEICGIHFYNSANSGGRGNSRIINSRDGDNYGSQLSFWTNPAANAPATQKMVINRDGNVGINTNNPQAKLHINGGNSSFSNNPRAYFSWADYGGTAGGGLLRTNSGPFGGIGVYATQSFGTNNYFISHQGSLSASDERIKKEIVDVEDDSALETLRLLKPKKYKYVDEVQRGTEPVWGFIAQEVRENLPFATQLRTDCLPNIYELANVSASNVITFTNFDTSNLESNAMVLKVYDLNDTEHLVNIAEVIDGHSIRVNEDLSEWTEDDKIFVYGQQVDDFVFLKKEAIFTIATSALQEVDRQLQAEKVKVTTIETQLTSVLTRLDALEGA
jgi:hypothetical protein